MEKEKRLFILKDSDNGSILTVVAINKEITHKVINEQVELTKESNPSRWAVRDIVEDLRLNLDSDLIDYTDWATVVA